MKSNLALFLLVLGACLTCVACDDGASSTNPSLATRRADEQRLAEVCSSFAGCFVLNAEFGDAKGFEACARLVEDASTVGALDQVSDCVAAAADCDAVGRCLNSGEPTAPCDAMTFVRGCDGTRTTECRNGVEVGRDCALDGLACVVDATGWPGCGEVGACGESRCDGNVAFACRNDAVVATDCGDGVCVLDSESMGYAVCAPAGAPCTQKLTSCDGDTAVSCVFGRTRSEVCEPGRCNESDGAFCLPGTECTESRCEGMVAVGCVNGVEHRVDCAAMGREGCESARCY